jgi:transcriptional regulator of arginine metabolism
MGNIGNKNSRLTAIKLIISSNQIGSQEELLQELDKAGFSITQATLSRDLKQLKVAKASSMDGSYVYVLPNNTMYKRVVDSHDSLPNMMLHTGFISMDFSGNLAVMKTRPGYASSMAYDIDNAEIRDILGTIAGDDTILMVLTEGADRDRLRQALLHVIPDLR